MLLTSLLTAIVRTDGDALVMHVGDRPYVVTSGGHVDLSTSGLALEAMEGMLSQLLPEEQMRALQEFGAVERAVAPPDGFHDGFKIVAARGGDDIWIEITRQRYREQVQVPQVPQVAQVPEVPEVLEEPQVPHVPQVLASANEPTMEPEVSAMSEVAAISEVAAVSEVAAAPEVSDVSTASEPVVAEDELYQLMAPPQEEAPAEIPRDIPEPVAEAAAQFSEPEVPATEPEPLAPAAPGVVVPLTRMVRLEAPPRTVTERHGSVERLLRLATDRGASAVYLTSQSRPFVRVEGEICALDGEGLLTSADVDAAIVELMPENAREAHERAQPTEWDSEFDDIGRIRCTTFHDYRGAGAIFHLMSARPTSAEQLGLSREIQALASEPEGLVVVASPRGAGKTTVLSALVDLINRNEGGYIISLERQIRVVHDNREALVSQREVRTATDAVNVVRAALRENPDALVIDDLNSPDVIQLALDAAGSGLLVFLSMTAGSTVSALMRIVDSFPPERRKPLQAVLAERLCGAVAQVLVRKAGGGHVAARELLLASDMVSNLIAEGHLSQLPVALESGHKLGMLSLNDALVGYLRNGLVEVREAYRKSYDRAGLLALLKREGKDASLVDRFG
jgi:twitching motility protein PilT